MRYQKSALLIVASVLACQDANVPTAAPFDVARDQVTMATPISAGRGIVRVEAYIDGRSSLILGTPTLAALRWSHKEFAAPGRLLGANLPTRFDAVDWFPSWPDVPDSENRDCFCFSYFEQHNLPLWPTRYDVGVEIVQARGAVTVLNQPSTAPYFEIEFNDNTPIGADWYIVRLNMRLRAMASPWPIANPFVVSLSRDLTMKVVLYGDGNLVFADQATEIALGDDRGLETPVALNKAGRPWTDIADVNQDGAPDLVMRFNVRDLVANGDAVLGKQDLRLTAHLMYGFIVARLPVEFVP